MEESQTVHLYYKIISLLCSSAQVFWSYLQGCECVPGFCSGRNQAVCLAGKQTSCTHPYLHPTDSMDNFVSPAWNSLLTADLLFSTQCHPSHQQIAYFHATSHNIHVTVSAQCCKKTIWRVAKAFSLFIFLSQVSAHKNWKRLATCRDLVLSQSFVVWRIPNSITRRSLAISAIWPTRRRWLLLLSKSCYEHRGTPPVCRAKNLLLVQLMF